LRSEEVQKRSEEKAGFQDLKTRFKNRIYRIIFKQDFRI
jgi:hypothetical protein